VLLCVRGKRAFDGERMLDRPTVLVEGERIIGVGVDAPSGVDEVDLGDVTLLPGLIDTHQHLCFDGIGTLEEQVGGVTDVALAERARGAARRAVQAGITTIRDLGDRGYLTLALRGEPDLPTILCAGPPITRVGGHCHYLRGEADGEQALVAAVRDRHDRQCDVVKVMATGGALTPTFPMWETQYTTAELGVVVEEAHALGLPVAAHCHGVAGIEQALEVGVDSIEHCTFFTTSGRSEPGEELMRRVAASGICVSATLGLLPGLPITNPVIAANMETVRGSRRRLYELGATIVAGTDAGITPAKPHDVLPYAFADLVAAGMSHLEGLRALTSVAAAICRVGDRKGRLARGWDADVLAVAGDPTVQTDALLAPVAVWRGGHRLR
jgi:imidazolonepropionase-like amidohydrolase